MPDGGLGGSWPGGAERPGQGLAHLHARFGSGRTAEGRQASRDVHGVLEGPLRRSGCARGQSTK